MAAVSVVEDADGVARLRINNRQQEGSSATLSLRRPAGVAAAAAASRARARAVPGSRHRRHRRRRRPRTPTLQVDAVELLPEVIEASAHFRRASAAARPIAAARDGRRRAALRARERTALRRDRLGQLPPGAQRLGRALHRRALRGRARAGWTRAACSASGCRCTSWISTACAASCSRSWRRIRRAGRCWRTTAWRRPCSGWSGAPTTGRFDAAAIRDRLARAPLPAAPGRARARRRARGAGQLRRGAGGAAALRRRRRRQHRRSSGGGVPRAAHHLRARFARRATGCSRCCGSCPAIAAAGADRRRRPIRPGRAAWPPTGRRATASSTSGRDVRPVAAACRTCWRRCASRCSSVLRISPDFRPAYDPLLAMATALARIGRRRRSRVCSPS